MTTHHTSGAADLPEALRYTNILDAWATDLPLAGKIAVELLRLHTLTEQQQRELIKESHRTAEQKLRADQMTEQHRHQAALNTEARAQLAALTAQAISVEPAGACAAELRRQHAELETLPVGYINRGIAPHTKGRTVFHEKPTINLEARWWSRDAPVFLASHGQAPATQQAGATKEHVRLVRVIADKIEDGTLFRSGIYSNKDLARFVRNVADAAAPQFPTAQAAGSVPAVEREQERIAFKDAHRHLELDEVPDAWGRPMFKHSHVEASWLGWIARASHGQAPASVLHLVHSAFAEIAMAFPKAFALHKVGIADTAVREALAAPATQQAGEVSESIEAAHGIKEGGQHGDS